MIDNYFKELYDDKALRPYVSQLVNEINDKFPNKYVVDTYKNLLEVNQYLEQDLDGLEKMMCSYLIKNGER